MKDDALKWYFVLPEKSIDRYEYFIHQLLQYFGYNIAEKVQFKYLCKIKQLPNQSLFEFIKVWKQTTNKITMFEKDLKYTFTNALFPMYKLLVSSNCDIKFGEMIDILFKKEACIKKLYAMCNNKTQTYEKKAKNPESNKKNAMNHVDKRKSNTNKTQRKLTKLIDTIKNILNVLIKEDLIELPPIVEPKFPNGVPKNFAIIIGYQDI